LALFVPLDPASSGSMVLLCFLLGAACSSCDLTLIPEDTVTPQTFFKTETDLRLWTNQLRRAVQVQPFSLEAMRVPDITSPMLLSTISSALF